MTCVCPYQRVASGCRRGHSRTPDDFSPLWDADPRQEGKQEEEVEIEKSNVLLLGPTGVPSLESTA